MGGGGAPGRAFGGVGGWWHTPKAMCVLITGSPNLPLPSLSPLTAHPNPNPNLCNLFIGPFRRILTTTTILLAFKRPPQKNLFSTSPVAL